MRRYKRDRLRDRNDERMLDEAYDRKQEMNERCADFVEAIQNIFESMDDPPEEKKRVHVAQRNMLSEYRLQLVNSGRKFRTLDQLLEHCRDLDIVRRDIEWEKSQRRQTPRNFIYQEQSRKTDAFGGYRQRSNDVAYREPRYETNGPSFQSGSQVSRQARTLKWKCWNCDSEGHGFRACPQPLRKFCSNCGLTGVDRDQCTQCKPNFRRDHGNSGRQ